MIINCNKFSEVGIRNVFKLFSSSIEYHNRIEKSIS